MPDNALVFRFLDAYGESTSASTDTVGRRAKILVQAAASEALEPEAEKRLSALLAEASANVKNASSRLTVGLTLFRLRGADEALALLRAGGTNERRAGLVIGSLLVEKAKALRDQPHEREIALREALATFLGLLMASPVANHEVITPIHGILRSLEATSGPQELGAIVAKQLPEVSSTDRMAFGQCLSHFFHGEFDAAFSSAQQIQSHEGFGDFLVFLRGSCLRGLAQARMREASRAGLAGTSEARESFKKGLVRAQSEFDRARDHVPSRLESLDVALLLLSGSGEDVQDELIAELQEFAQEPSGGFRAAWLLARAYRVRFGARYPDEKVKNSELGSLLAHQRRWLRTTIEQAPQFVLAYIALAETYHASHQADQAAGGTGVSRQMIEPDYRSAVSALLASPAGNEALEMKLADYYRRLKEHEKAEKRLEGLTERVTSSEAFHQLITSYLRRGNEDAAMLFLADEAPAGLSDAEVRRRERFRDLRGSEGLRHMYRGQMYSLRQGRERTPSGKKRQQLAALSSFERSYEAYQSDGIDAPLVVLNNVAWFLSEADDEDRRKRGLLVAQAAVDRLANPIVVADVYDTYGWALYRNGKLLEAEKVFRELNESNEQPGYLYHWGRVLFDMSEYGRAVSMFQDSLEARGNFPEKDAAREWLAKARRQQQKLFGEETIGN